MDSYSIAPRSPPWLEAKTQSPFSLFSETSFERFRIRSLEGRVFLPARRWCLVLELGRA